METICYLNGEEKKHSALKLHLSDLGFCRGYGIFDFLRTQDGVPLFLEAYTDRFFASAAALDLPMPLSKQALKALIRHLTEKNKGQDWGIRLLLTGGYSENYFTPGKPNFAVLFLPLHFPTPQQYQQGIDLMCCAHQRSYPTIKSLNYFTAIKLQKKMRKTGAEDLLYCHENKVTESSRSNFFVVKNGELLTPKNQILKGITREKVIEIAQKEMPVSQTDLTPEMVFSADEAFLTSTTKKILAIRKIDGKTIGQGTHRFTRLLSEKFRDFSLSYLKDCQKPE